MNTVEVNNTWGFTCSSLVFLMAPAVVIANSCNVTQKNRINTMLSNFIGMMVSYLLYYAIGYSLIFSSSSTSIFVGDFRDSFLMNTIKKYDGMDLMNFLGQMSGIGLVISLLLAGGVERTSLKSVILYLILWLPFVYCIPMYWFTNPNGWIKTWGIIDYSCGLPNLIISTSVLVYSKFVGKRKDVNDEVGKKTQATFGFLATFLIWFAWIGLNAGGTGGANARAMIAVINTNLSGVVCSLTTAVFGFILFKGNIHDPAMYCKGLIAGLLAISPAAGFVSFHYSLVFGLISGIACSFTVKLKEMLFIDEPCGIIETHGAGSFVGMILIAFFADSSIAEINEGDPINNGVIFGNFTQIYIQLLSTMAVIGWVFATSTIICLVLKFTPFLGFKLNEEKQHLGLDYLACDQKLEKGEETV